MSQTPAHRIKMADSTSGAACGTSVAACGTSVAAPAPGTIYRFYPDSLDSHYTAVQLKTGGILEVKNPVAKGTKTPFESVEAWIEARKGTLNTLETDTSRVAGRVAAKAVGASAPLPTVDKGGFTVPRYSVHFNKWLIWCYEMIEEAAPDLLASDAVKTAYNNLVAACAKHTSDLRFTHFSTKGKHRYKQHFSWVDSPYYAWKGMPVIMKGEAIWYNPKEDSFEPIRKELTPPYKALYDLVGQQIRAHIEAYNAVKSAKHRIAASQRRIAKLERAISRVTRHYRAEIERHEADIARNKVVVDAWHEKTA